MKFNIEAIEAGSVWDDFKIGDGGTDTIIIEPSTADLEAARQIDAFSKRLSDFDPIYPTVVFIGNYDAVLAIAYQSAGLANAFAGRYDVPSSVKAIARKQASNTYRAATAMRTAAHREAASRIRLGDTTDVKAPNFRRLAMASLRQSAASASTINFLKAEHPGWTGWIIFDFNKKIDMWLAARVVAMSAVLIGEINPYVDKKIKEAIEAGAAKAEEVLDDKKAAAWKYVVGGGLLALSVWGVARVIKKRRRY